MLLHLAKAGPMPLQLSTRNFVQAQLLQPLRSARVISSPSSTNLLHMHIDRISILQLQLRGKHQH